ncbi:MAG: hypothetical protein VYA34_04710 [Myxococcota bacterium]|nr:hypothetical protein [Myxococcota bacterium]
MTLEGITIWLIGSLGSAYQSLRGMVEAEGGDFVFWENTGAAVSLIASEGKPHAIFIEDLAPYNDFITIVKSVKGTTRHSGIPLIGVSDEYNANMREVGKRVGLTGWMTTPLDEGRLKNVLEDCATGHLVSRKYKRDVLFDVKMGRLWISRIKQKIYIRGMMSQTSNFARLAELISPDETHIYINWSGLQCINVDGVSAWYDFRKELRDRDIAFTFEEAPLGLVQFYLLFPQLFGPVEIKNVILPLSSELRYALARTVPNDSNSIGRLMEDRLQYVFSVSSDCRVMPYRPTIISEMLEMTHQGEESSWVGLYLTFLHSSVIYKLTEFFITREAVLDQVSRIAAKFSCFRSVMKVLNVNVAVRPPGREPMVQIVQKCYEPIITILVALERILHSLRTKAQRGASPDLFIGNRVSEVCKLLDTPIFETVFDAVVVEDLLALEQRYDADRTKERLDILILACCRVACTGFRILVSIVNELGIRVMEMLRVYTQFDHFPQFRLAVEAATLIPEEDVLPVLEDLRFHSGLELGQCYALPGILKAIWAQCLDFESESTRLTQILTAHDVMSQCCEHRICEIEALSSGGGNTDIVALLGENAVTILEKQLVACYYPELKDWMASEGGVGEFEVL